MKIVDLDSLIIIYRDVYSELYKESIDELNTLYTTNSKQFYSTISLPFASFYSRDPTLTEVHKLNVKFKLLRYVIDNYNKNEIAINVDNYFIKNCLEEYLCANNIRGYKIISKKTKLSTYINSFIEICSSLIIFYYKLLKLLYFKFITSLFFRLRIDIAKEKIIVDTFYMSDAIKKRQIIDRYHTKDFYEDLNSKYPNQELYILPEINFLNLSYRDIIFLKKSYPNSLLKFEWITYINFLEIVYIAFRILFTNNYYICKKKSHYLFNIFFWENLVMGPKLLIHLQNYFVIKNLKKRQFEISHFFDWWENQTVDKVLHFSFHKFFSKTIRIGVISYIVDMDLNNHLYPSANEHNLQFTPNHYWVWSSYFGKKIQERSPFFQYFEFKQSRFSYLKNVTCPLQYDENYILVMLPIDTSISFLILDYIKKFVNENEYFTFFIKIHPANTRKIENINLNNNMRIIIDSSIDFTLNYKLVISSNSSASMESILSYRYLLLVSSSKDLNNVLNNIVPDTLYKNAYTYSDFKFGLFYLINRNITDDLIIFNNIRANILSLDLLT